MQLIPGDAKRLVRCVRRVLVAEDDEDTRTLLAWGLRLHGYEVVEVKSGTELFEVLTLCLNAEEQMPDVILSDVRMPGFSGLEVLGCIDRAELGVPFILMTAFSDEETRKRGENNGAAAFLAKPFEFEKLLAAIDESLGEPAKEVRDAVPEAPVLSGRPSARPTTGTRPAASARPSSIARPAGSSSARPLGTASSAARPAAAIGSRPSSRPPSARPPSVRPPSTRSATSHPFGDRGLGDRGLADRNPAGRRAHRELGDPDLGDRREALAAGDEDTFDDTPLERPLSTRFR